MRKIPDCQNQFCRYWKDNDCLQNTIAVDQRGMCLHFVRVSVPKGYLDRKRKALRKQKNKVFPMEQQRIRSFIKK